MDGPQHDGAKVKAEDDELGIWVPVKQEPVPAEHAPADVPQAEPTDDDNLGFAAPYSQWVKKNSKQKIPLSAHQHDLTFEQMPKKGRHGARLAYLEKLTVLLREELKDSRKKTESATRTLRIENLEEQSFRLEQKLLKARKGTAIIITSFTVESPKKKSLLSNQVSEATVTPKQSKTTTDLSEQIFALEKELNGARRKVEIAERDSRALKKDQVDAEALEKELAELRAKNKAMATVLQTIAKEGQEYRTAQSGSGGVNEREVGMAGLQGRVGRRTRKRARIEAEDEDEYMDSE